MSKNLVFCNAEINTPDGKTVKTWELVCFGQSPVLHAIWSPKDQKLVVQFDSVKEGIVPDYKRSNSGKVTENQRRMDQYYITRISDKDAIQSILDNFVINYKDQHWLIEDEQPNIGELTSADQLESLT